MKIVIDMAACAGEIICDGICVQMCPEGVLAIENEKPVVVDEEACIDCKACELACDYDAIKHLEE